MAHRASRRHLMGNHVSRSFKKTRAAVTNYQELRRLLSSRWYGGEKWLCLSDDS